MAPARTTGAALSFSRAGAGRLKFQEGGLGSGAKGWKMPARSEAKAGKMEKVRLYFNFFRSESELMSTAPSGKGILDIEEKGEMWKGFR